MRPLLPWVSRDFDTKADVVKCIGANGRKWRGGLRNSPRAVLEKLAGVLGVLVREEQKRRRLTKDKRR